MVARVVLVSRKHTVVVVGVGGSEVVVEKGNCEVVVVVEKEGGLVLWKGVSG